MTDGVSISDQKVHGCRECFHRYLYRVTGLKLDENMTILEVRDMKWYSEGIIWRPKFQADIQLFQVGNDA